MNAKELLAEAAARGVKVYIQDGSLRCKGRRSQIAELLPRLKAHKPELLALLAATDGVVGMDARGGVTQSFFRVCFPGGQTYLLALQSEETTRVVEARYPASVATQITGHEYMRDIIPAGMA